VKRGVNAWIYPPSLDVARILEASVRLGFEGVELNVDEKAFSPERLSKGDRAEVADKAASFGLELPSLCSGLFWKYNLGGADPTLRKHGIRLGKQCCDLASDLGAKVVLMVPAVASPTVHYEEMWTLAKAAVQEIGLVAGDAGVTLGVENVWNRFLYSPLEFVQFLREVNLESVKAYFDVGNILFLGFPQQWIRALGREIACVHVKDFDLKRREFTGLLRGDVPWPEVMAALRAVGYDGFLNVELGPDPSDPLKAAGENEAALGKILTM